MVSNDFFVEAVEELRKGKSVRLFVGGQSMYPFIHGGKDEIEVVNKVLSNKAKFILQYPIAVPISKIVFAFLILTSNLISSNPSLVTIGTLFICA